MQRYFIKQDTGIIEGQDQHHILNVMRNHTGDQVILCIEEESMCFLVTLHIQNKTVSYEKMDILKETKSREITVIQGIPKNPKSEFIIKYATMFGASRITFVEMQRSIAKVSHIEQKQNRFELIAKESAELAHRFDIPAIDIQKSLSKISLESYDGIILLDEDEHTVYIQDVIDDLKAFTKIAVIIGPEGGISKEERAYLKEHNARILSLGHTILATEAASLAFLSYFMA